MKIRNIAIITAFCTLATSTSVLAAKANFSSSTKSTTKIPVKSVNYDYDDSDDDIEIDFSSKIKLKSSAKATVKDSSGKCYTTYIEDHDNNEIDLDVNNLKAGKKYTVTISGIKKSTASKYGTLTLTFSIPKASTNLVKDVDYDVDDREVTFDFRNNVSYKNAKVVITNTSNSKAYTTRILEKDNDELSVRVSGLTKGNSYKYKITGVTSKADGSTKTLSGTFKAVDND
ncbi:MAG: Ig-like domain-containing protein [bacterium]|nr:Ig-like domain-containing protein [bacterium]